MIKVIRKNKVDIKVDYNFICAAIKLKIEIDEGDVVHEKCPITFRDMRSDVMIVEANISYFESPEKDTPAESASDSPISILKDLQEHGEFYSSAIEINTHNKAGVDGESLESRMKKALAEYAKS